MLHCFCTVCVFRQAEGRRLFQVTAYEICVLSDDEIVRKNVAAVFRASFQVPGTDKDEPDAQEIIRHAIQAYRHHRVCVFTLFVCLLFFHFLAEIYCRICFQQVDYTTCADRVVTAFYDEFTNWDAVFGLIQRYIGEDYVFVEKIFQLLQHVYKYVKTADTPEELEESETLLREHAQGAIRCLAQIDRATVHVDLVDYLIGAILHADKELKLLREVSAPHCFCCLFSIARS